MFDVSLPWANFWYDVFNVILFAGAFAVAVGTYGSIKMGAVKERFADERISQNESETKRAIADSDIAKEGTFKSAERIAELQAESEKARADIAMANARAAEATKIAEQERSSRTKLETAMAWRSLSDEQLIRIETKIRGFAGQSVQFITYRDDPEPIQFMERIGLGVHNAGWSIVPAVSWLAFNVRLGITVEYSPSKSAQFRPAAEAFAAALRSENVDANVSENAELEQSRPEMITVIVGKKAERIGR